MSQPMIPFIDLRAQYQALKPQIQERINRVLEHGQYIMGPEVKELEDRLASYVGVKHCIAASSGTDTVTPPALGVAELADESLSDVRVSVADLITFEQGCDVGNVVVRLVLRLGDVEAILTLVAGAKHHHTHLGSGRLSATSGPHGNERVRALIPP